VDEPEALGSGQAHLAAERPVAGVG
jgi:hypothetical protein